MEYIIAFKNTNHAIKAEQCLLAEKYKVNVMPLPSQIRAGCGICLRISPLEIIGAMKILEQNHISEIKLYVKEIKEEKSVLSEIKGRAPEVN